MVNLSRDFGRTLAPWLLSASLLGLGGCASMTHTDIESCTDKTSYGFSGTALSLSLQGGGDPKKNDHCLRARDAATIVLNKLPNGDYSVWGLKFGQIYYEKADPKVKEYFDRMLLGRGLTVKDLPRLERDLNLPTEVHVSESAPADKTLPLGTPEGYVKKRVFLCRQDDGAQRCSYRDVALPAAAP